MESIQYPIRFDKLEQILGYSIMRGYRDGKEKRLKIGKVGQGKTTFNNIFLTRYLTMNKTSSKFLVGHKLTKKIF